MLLAALLAAPIGAHGDEAQDLKASIVVACIYQVGEFGAGLVDICLKENLAAAQALAGYPPSAAGIVGRCTDRLQGDGWAKIKMCADQEIEAAAVVQGYEKDHSTLVAGCRSGARGPVEVKACVEKALAEGKSGGA